jgi:hypothetical protein
MRSIRRELRKRWKVYRLRIWWLATLLAVVLVSVEARGAEPAGSAWEVVLKKGAVAPFEGVLVPDYLYRQYSLASDLYPECDERLSDVMNSCMESELGWSRGEVALAVALSFFAGYGVAQATR